MSIIQSTVDRIVEDFAKPSPEPPVSRFDRGNGFIEPVPSRPVPPADFPHDPSALEPAPPPTALERLAATPGAAEAFAAYDRARATPPTIAFNAPGTGPLIRVDPNVGYGAASDAVLRRVPALSALMRTASTYTNIGQQAIAEDQAAYQAQYPQMYPYTGPQQDSGTLYGQTDTPSPGFLAQVAMAPYRGANEAIDKSTAFGTQVGKFFGSNVLANPIGAGMGGFGGGDVGATTPQQREQIGQAGGVAGGFAPIAVAYALAPQIGVPTAALDAYFAIEGVGTVKDTIDGYRSGELSGEAALLRLAMTAPNFLPVLLHGTGALAKVAKSPRGQALIADARTRLASESGALSPGERSIQSEITRIENAMDTPAWARMDQSARDATGARLSSLRNELARFRNAPMAGQIDMFSGEVAKAPEPLQPLKAREGRQAGMFDELPPIGGATTPPENLMVPPDRLDYDPKMQARAVAQGQTFDPRVVKQIVENFDPDMLTALDVAPTPGQPGRYTVLGGMHRGPALKQLGIEAPVKVHNLDLTDPAQYKRAQQIADSTNTGQRDVSLKGLINIINRSGTEDVTALRAKHPRFNDQQIIDAQYTSILPGHVIDKLDAMPASAPQIGIAAEVGRGAKVYGLTPSQAEGLYNQFTSGPRKSMLTRAEVRNAIDLAGPKMRESVQGGMFGANEATTNPLVDAMLEHAKLSHEINQAKAALARNIKGALAIKISPKSPEIIRARQELAGLEAQRAQLDTEFFGTPANASASSMAEARGNVPTSSAETPGLGPQAPPKIVSARGEVAPSSSTTRQTEPSGALLGPASTENIAPSVPPSTGPGELVPAARSGPPEIASSFQPSHVGANSKEFTITGGNDSYNMSVLAEDGGQTLRLWVAREGAGMRFPGEATPGGSIAGIRQVGVFLQDLADKNPAARIIANPTDERLAAIYQRMGFDPAPGWREMQLNRERFAQTASTGASEAARALPPVPATAAPEPPSGGEVPPPPPPAERPPAAVYDEYRKLYGPAAEQKMVEAGLIPETPVFAQVKPPVPPTATARAGAEALGIGAPAPKRPPAFDAEGRPIEMKSGEPYAQFDSHGNPIDPSTGQPLNDKSVAARLNGQPTVADQAALQIIEWLRIGEKARPEQRAMFAQERARQAAKMEAVYKRGGTSAEAMAAGGGGFKRPFLAPLKLTPEGEQALRQEIRSSTIMGHPGNKAAAEKAIDAMNAGVLPETAQAVQLSRIVGGPTFLDAMMKVAPRDWKAEVIGVLGIPKGMQTFLDASAVFRQMAPLGFGNPAEYIDSIGTIGRAAHSLESARAVQAETDALPWITMGGTTEAEALGINFRNLGGRMADIGGHLQESEGAFSGINRSAASQALEKVPGYQLSERIFNVPINRERGLVFSKFAQNMWDAGERDVSRYKAVADVVDHASGWSNLAPAQIAKGLNAFYSARNFMARFQVLLDPILQPGSLFQPSARQLAAKNLVGFVSANAAMLGLMAGSGALVGTALGIPNPVHVGLDPRSSDGFKGRIGNTRIDMTAGFGPIIRLVAQLSPIAVSPYTLATEGKWSNPRATSIGGIVHNASAVDLVNNFFASKQDPVFHLLWNAMKFPGGQAYGEDFRSVEGARTAMLHLFTPFFVQDVVEAWRGESKNTALITAPISFLGGGVNTYEQSAAGAKANAKADRVKLGYPDEAALFKANKAFATSKYASQFDTLDAYEKDWLAKPENQGALAHQKALDKFSAAPDIRRFRADIAHRKLTFYRQHPAQLVKDADAGAQALDSPTLQGIYRAEKKRHPTVTP